MSERTRERPKRLTQLRVRLNDTEAASVAQGAKTLGVTPSEFCREAIVIYRMFLAAALKEKAA